MALEDELVNRVTWKIPNALALVGSAAGGGVGEAGVGKSRLLLEFINLVQSLCCLISFIFGQ